MPTIVYTWRAFGLKVKTIKSLEFWLSNVKQNCLRNVYFLTCTGTLSDILLIASSFADNCSSGIKESTTFISWEELLHSTVSGNGWKKFDKSSSSSLKFHEKSDNRPERLFLWAMGEGLDFVSHFTLAILRQHEEYFEQNSLICCITTLYRLRFAATGSTDTTWLNSNVNTFSKMLCNLARGPGWFSTLNVPHSPTSDISQWVLDIIFFTGIFGEPGIPDDSIMESPGFNSITKPFLNELFYYICHDYHARTSRESSCVKN